MAVVCHVEALLSCLIYACVSGRDRPLWGRRELVSDVAKKEKKEKKEKEPEPFCQSL